MPTLSRKIIVASDRPIPSAGGERFLHDCERLLERSPLKAECRRYRLYVTGENRLTAEEANEIMRADAKP